jgi:Cys-tRNA(Pro)/Cys-tRNA(Cys) deacylase
MDDVMTPAIEAAAASGAPYRVVRTERAGSAEEAARLQGIPLDALLRTIVVRRGNDDYVFVLVPAGRRFDWPKLRAHLGVSRLSLPDADEAREVTGYERYTITPFARPGHGPSSSTGQSSRTRSCRSAAARSGSTCTWPRVI